MKKIKYIVIVCILTMLAAQSCKKEKAVFEDPYGEAKEGLGISINRQLASVPASGTAGTIVFVKATGLLPYKGKIKFMFNGEEGEIQELTEAGIKVKVPVAGSSGITSMAIEGQLILGPVFSVFGLINFDPSFKATQGANGLVNQVYPLADGRNLVIGGFTNYDNKGIVFPLNRIVRTSSDGELDRTFRVGKAVNGELSTLFEIGGKFAIAGGFSGYNQRTDNISNVTSLNRDGTIDTMGIITYQRAPLKDTLKFYPKFNGGTNSFISGLYPHQGKILATGNFRYYVKRKYGKPNYNFTRDSVILDSTEIRQVLRFNLDGSLDSTFRFNLSTHKGLSAGNGDISSFVHTQSNKLDKIVLYGGFSTFDQQKAGRIIRLSSNGNPDPTFNAGTGADNYITSLTYNSTTNKYLITGNFRSYNGKTAIGVALLNEDGSLDESFKASAFEGGYPRYAKQLIDGLIVVSGDFKKYNSVTRGGFMVIDSKGLLVPGYNATGPFYGFLRDVVETKSADNKRALLIIGGFYRFDNQPVNNIIRVTIE